MPTAAATIAPAGQQSWLIPAYQYPTSGPLWATLAATRPASLPGYVIANVDSGPGTTLDPTYAAAVDNAESAGWTIVGYVDTAEATVSLTAAEAQVSTWKSLYGVDDIFFDDVTGTSLDLGYYEALTGYVHAQGGIDILNPGTPPGPGYLSPSVANAIVVMEGTLAAFQSTPPPDYPSSATQIGYIITSGPSSQDLTSTLQAIKALGGDLVYVTDQGDDYNSLPSYFAAENNALAATPVAPASPPTSVAPTTSAAITTVSATTTSTLATTGPPTAATVAAAATTTVAPTTSAAPAVTTVPSPVVSPPAVTTPVAAPAVAAPAATTTVAPATTVPPAATTSTLPPAAATTAAAAATTTTAAPTTTVAPPVPADNPLTPPARVMPYSVFNSDAQDWAVSAESSQYVSDFVTDYQDNYGNVGVNTAPIYWVSADQVDSPISVTTGCNDFTSETGTEAPIPTYASLNGSSDDPLMIYQPSTGTAWEFWEVQANPDGSYSACWGGKLSMSTSNGVFPSPFGLSATGISYLGTTITEADVASGSIDHAIAVALPGCYGYVYPADREDCPSHPDNVPGQPPEGQWFRFPANLPMPSGLTPFGQMVFKAIQTYGMVVTDYAGAVMLEAEQPSDWAAEGNSGTDPVTASWDGQAEYSVVANLPWSELQAVRLG